MSKNPFYLDPNDVFKMRSKERAAKAARNKNVPIWKKTTMKHQRGVKRQVHKTRLSDQHHRNKLFSSHRSDLENMSDFLGKKKNMFLIQMSLETKREEITKLEERASRKEMALRKSEMLLEEDAMRFDAFLKENDRKAHDALKTADAVTRDRQETQVKIKKLQAQIRVVNKEMSGYKSELETCLQYKKFLDDLTPQEHFNKYPPGEAPLYFQQPEQLLHLFAQLEERNLFLIQNAQETEEALEELKQKYEDKKHEMESKTQKLEDEILVLRQKIQAEENKSISLTQRRQANSAAGLPQKLLKELSSRVRTVYEQCGFDPDNQTDSIDQLREVEGWLEYLLNELYQMPLDKVAAEEKEKQTQRRNVKRNERKEEAQRSYESRLAKSTARAKAEVVKNTGKPVMFRSPPIRKKVKKETKLEKDEVAEEIMKYFM